jgi:hypothetical protein
LKNTITEEKIKKKKLADNRNTSNDYTNPNDNSNIHKRNQSEINYYNNNLNISLMNYEKPILNNYYNSTVNKINSFKKDYNHNQGDNQTQNLNQCNTVNSFMYNPQLYSHFQNSPKINENVGVAEITQKGEDVIENTNEGALNNPSSINMNEFTLNRNDGHFIEIIKSIDNSPLNNQNNILKNLNPTTINAPDITNNNSFTPPQNKNQFIMLENKMDELLSTVPSAENANNDNERSSIINKRYTILKKTFDDFLIILNNENNHSKGLLIKINEGYNECVVNTLSSYGKVKEKVSDYDNVLSSKLFFKSLDYKNLNKKYGDILKAYQEKNEEVKMLKLKLAEISFSPINKSLSGEEYKENKHKEKEYNFTNSNSNLMQSPLKAQNQSHTTQIHKNLSQKTNCLSTDVNSQNEINTLSSVAITPTETNEICIGKNRSRMINMIKQNVLDDLDAICFFDKINMRPNSASHSIIPKLDLNFLNSKQKKNDDRNIKKVNVKIFYLFAAFKIG